MEEVEATAEDVVAVMVVEVVKPKDALEANHVAEAGDVIPININTTIKGNTVASELVLQNTKRKQPVECHFRKQDEWLYKKLPMTPRVQ